MHRLVVVNVVVIIIINADKKARLLVVITFLSTALGLDLELLAAYNVARPLCCN